MLCQEKQEIKLINRGQFCNYKEFYDERLIDRDRFLGYHSDKNLEEARKAYLRFVEAGLKEEKKPKWLKSQKFV